jgi:hypothetical protein
VSGKTGAGAELFENEIVQRFMRWNSSDGCKNRGPATRSQRAGKLKKLQRQLITTARSLKNDNNRNLFPK